MILTSQSVRVKMTDYKRYCFMKHGLSVHDKINLRNNILLRGIPESKQLFI